jgi:hypothetical protein
MLRIGYGTAPNLVYWWLDGYVDFSPEQSVRARQAIAQWFAWNRRTQVPDYAELLARAQREVESDTTPARVCEWQADLTQRALTGFERIVPAAAELMLTISPKQELVLEQRYAKNNEEYRRDYLNPDPRRRAQLSLERTLDRAEMLYGELDEAQRARIEDILAHSPFDPELWLAERRQRQQDVLKMLRTLNSEGAGHDQAETALKAYVHTLQVSPRDAYRRYSEQLAVFNCAAAASLHNSTTAQQRQVAAARLKGWEGDLRAIAAAADPVEH